MKSQYIFALLLIGCSAPPNLSEGSFDIRRSAAFEQTQIFTTINLEQDTIVNGRVMNGRMFLEGEDMFSAVAKDLGLNYTKIFFYYPNANLYKSIKIGQDVDTLDCEIRFYDTELTDGDYKRRNESVGIMTRFENQTHSYDTTFVLTFKVIIKG